MRSFSFQGIVEIFELVVNKEEFDDPWRSNLHSEVSGWGLWVIHEDKSYIVTTPRCVTENAAIVLKDTNGSLCNAIIKSDGNPSDMVLLEVQNANLLRCVAKVKVGEMAQIKQIVKIINVHIFDELMFIATPGLVSRIEKDPALSNDEEGVRVQIDTAMNNISGDFVTSGDTIVGIVSQQYSGGCVEMIPIPSIIRFLEKQPGLKHESAKHISSSSSNSNTLIHQSLSYTPKENALLSPPKTVPPVVPPPLSRVSPSSHSKNFWNTISGFWSRNKMPIMVATLGTITIAAVITLIKNSARR